MTFKNVSSASAKNNLLFWLFVGLIGLVNAAMTFGFGLRFGGEIVSASPTLGAFVFLVIFDIAAIGWTLALRRDNLSPQQRACAGLLAYASIICSTIVSIVHIALSTSLVDLSSSYDGIGVAALAMLCLIAGGHFIGIFYYLGSSLDALKANSDAETSARRAAFRIVQSARIARKSEQLVEQNLDKELPTISQKEASLILANFMTQFTHDDTEPEVEAIVLPQESDIPTDEGASPTLAGEIDFDFDSESGNLNGHASPGSLHA